MNILMLHDIRDFQQFFFPERYKLPYFLTTKQFDNILNNLIPNRSLLQINNELEIDIVNIKNNTTLLTFDDGLKDHLAVARKLVSKKVKGCFFVPSGPIIERSIIDSHKIQFVLASVSPEKIVESIKNNFEIHFDKSSNYLNDFYISRWENNIWSKEMIFVTRLLREFPDKTWRKKLLNELFYKYVTNDLLSFANDFYLSSEDVSEIYNLGHIIGGHGHYSYDLRFEDQDTIISEIKRMNDFLNLFHQQNKMYAYANGGFNQIVMNELIKLKFNYAFTTKHTPLTELTNVFEIPRIDATKTNLIFNHTDGSR